MSLRVKINADLKEAMRDKNEVRLSVLRMLLSALKEKEISLRRGNEIELSDEQVIETIGSEIKKRNDSIAAYNAGGRFDLAEREEKEISVLLEYMPAQLSSAELEDAARAVVAAMGEVSMKDFGRIMGQVMSKVKGQAQGDQVSAAVKKILSS